MPEDLNKVKMSDKVETSLSDGIVPKEASITNNDGPIEKLTASNNKGSIVSEDTVPEVEKKQPTWTRIERERKCGGEDMGG